jgi:hypothetical protein
MSNAGNTCIAAQDCQYRALQLFPAVYIIDRK